MHRRKFLTAAAVAASPLPAAQPVRFGVDLFSIRSQGWTPFQYLDYCAAQKAKVVHFSEIRFIGNLEPENLRKVRAYAEERGIKVAIENHAGDMQGWELRNLIEAAGKEFVGACLDSGNPCWTLEDPHATLEALHPYVLTSHVRDSAVWRTPQGAAVSWVRMGDGNVNIDEYCRKYAALCPGRALSME